MHSDTGRTARPAARASAAVALLALLAGCGEGGPFGQTRDDLTAGQRTPLDRIGVDDEDDVVAGSRGEGRDRLTILFGDRDDADTTTAVNKYLWAASLDVLSFLPIEAADPFTGILQFGYGRPPGGGQAYQATVLISDPALDARSLNVSLRTRSGPVSAETQRAIEDAILTRARQIRIADSRL